MTDPRTALPNYNNTFDPAKGFQSLAVHDDRYAHAHEQNVMQDIERERVKRIADVLLRDGSLVSGGVIALGEIAAGEVVASLDAARVYIRGAVHDVAERELTISAVGTVVIGIRLRTYVVTHLDDPTLKGIAPGTEGEGEPGASALVMRARWGFDGDGEDGDFFPIYTVVDGILQVDPPPAVNDAWLNMLARYDRDAHASYVVEGHRVRAIGLVEGAQEFTVSEGTINVYGYKRSRSASLRLRVPEEPDLHQINFEPHAVDSGVQTISPRFTPIAAVQEVVITSQKTVNVTHGPFSGAIDPLPDETVVSIMSVTQGETTYAPGADYLLTGSAVDWTPGGAEPAPGSNYSVTYRYTRLAEVANVTGTSFEIDGAADDTVAFVKYTMKLPRTDAIVADRDGIVSYRRGLSSLYAPQPVRVATDMLKLADVRNRWGEKPDVRQVGVIRVPFHDLRDMERMLGDLYALVSEERLQRDVSSREPVAKRGVFVDPFLDDDMRDQGLEQTGAIALGLLRLPIAIETHFVEAPANTLAFTEEVIVQQQRVTGGMKINPYQVFTVPPLNVPLEPSIDLWSEEVVTWTSAETTRVVGAGNILVNAGTTVEERVLSSRTEEIETIRQREVAFTIDGFGPNEQLTKVTFDGVDVTPSI